MSPDDVRQILRVLCATTTTLGLATVDSNGDPYAANVNFVADGDLNLYFVSDPDSVHCRHIAASGRVAATAYAPFGKPEEIRGLQLRGQCRAIAEDEFDRIWNLFCNRFAYAAQFETRVRQEQFYRIEPNWIRYLDNAVRFGYKWQTVWPPAGEVDS